MDCLLQYIESAELLRWQKTAHSSYVYPHIFLITNEKHDSRIEFYKNGYVDFRIQNLVKYTTRRILYTDALFARIRTSGANDINFIRRKSVKGSLSPNGLSLELTDKRNHPLTFTEKQFNKIEANLETLNRCISQEYVNTMKNDLSKIRKIFF